MFLLSMASLSATAQVQLKAIYHMYSLAEAKVMEKVRQVNKGNPLIEKYGVDGNHTMVLLINGDRSVFMQHANEQKLDDQGVKITQIGPGFSTEALFLYKDRHAGRLTVAREFLAKNYVMEDSLRQPGWQTADGQKEIGGLACRKAVIGDSIVAWYTPDISIGEGPDSYWGLPGLIMELTLPGISYQCLSVETDTNDEWPAVPKGKRVTFKEFENIRSGYFKRKR